MSRQSRETQKREYEARELDEYPSMAEGWLGPLQLPPTVVPPEGMVYGWITEAVMQVPDVSNMQHTFYRGWRPVPLDRHPEFFSQAIAEFYGKDFSTNGRITKGGSCLAERPLKPHEKEVRYYQNLADRKADSTAWARKNSNINFRERQNQRSYGPSDAYNQQNPPPPYDRFGH
jgi:hypothetical protein